jgi:cation:H+ antiporter
VPYPNDAKSLHTVRVAGDVLVLVVGLVVLVYGADAFVLGSARLAESISMPRVVIGAVVMGFGTSAPELLVSTIAAGRGNLDLGVGNVVGSNVANLSLVLGTAALVASMTIRPSILRREIPLSVGATIAFAVVIADGRIDRWEGVLLASALVVAIWILLRSDVPAELGEIEEALESFTTRTEVVRLMVGLVGTVLGAQFVVWGAGGLADRWGVSGGFIGFSLVAVGTSLPELVTTVSCARRNETELIVGNLFGSNMFNSLAVGGAMGLVGPGAILDGRLYGAGAAFMVIIAVGAFLLGLNGRQFARTDGVLLLAVYLTAMLYIGSGAGEFDEEAVSATGSAPAET